MYISHSVMDRLGVKATNSKAKAKAKAKDTPAGLEAPQGQGRGLEDSISGNVPVDGHSKYNHGAYN